MKTVKVVFGTLAVIAVAVYNLWPLDDKVNNWTPGDQKCLQDRQKIAESYLARAQSGEFVREAQDQINEVNQTLAAVSQGQNDAQSFLSGGWGNLATSFLDPEYVRDNEINHWQELKDRLDEWHRHTSRFLDMSRTIAGMEYDEFGESHPTSAHLWAEHLQNELNASQAIILQSLKELKQIKQAIEKHKRDPTNRRSNRALLGLGKTTIHRFSKAVIRFKVAQTTLNALYNAYLKDPSLIQDFPSFPPEPFYNTTKEKMERARDQAQQQILPQINTGFEMGRALLLELGENSGLDNAAIDHLIEILNTQYQSDQTGPTVPLGFAHRGYAVSNEGRWLAQESLDFYNDRLQILSSNPSMSQLLQLAQNHLDLTHKQLAFAQNKLLPFLRIYALPSAQALTQKWKGFAVLYREACVMF